MIPSVDLESLDMEPGPGVECLGGYVCADGMTPAQPVYHRSQKDCHLPLRYGHPLGFFKKLKGE